MLADHGCNPLEAGVAVKHLDVVFLSNGLDGFGGYDSFHNVFLACDTAEFGVTGHDVVEENHHDLVAVEKHVFALVVAEHAAHTVSIGVGCHDQVGAHFLGFCNAESHCRGDLGVG